MGNHEPARHLFTAWSTNTNLHAKHEETSMPISHESIQLYQQRKSRTMDYERITRELFFKMVDKDLTLSATRCLLYLIFRANPKQGTCHINLRRKHISDDLNIDRITVYRAITELKAKHFISIDDDGIITVNDIEKGEQSISQSNHTKRVSEHLPVYNPWQERRKLTRSGTNGNGTKRIGELF